MDKKKRGAAWLIAAGLVGGVVASHCATASAALTQTEANSMRPFARSQACYRQEWARRVLKRLRVPLTESNREALIAWSIPEAGHFGNTATNNPLNTSMVTEGSWVAIGLDKIRGYPTLAAGADATAKTLKLRQYRRVRAALKRGNNPQAVIDAAAKSPWAVSHYRRVDWKSLRRRARQQMAVDCEPPE